jgi:hypothetical protein
MMASSIFHWFTCEQHLCSPLFGKIFPPGIFRFDQINLFDPQPAFQLLLSSNRWVNVVEAFVVDQAITVIFAGESLDLAALMLHGTAVNAVRHTDVERAGATGYDVDEIFVILHGNIHPLWHR